MAIDYRKWYDVFPMNPSTVAVARKVDCDVGSMSLERKAELMREAVGCGWLPKDCYDRPERVFVPLGSRRPVTMNRLEAAHLDNLQREAGMAFAEGDSDWRELACFSWHVYLSLFDIWPVGEGTVTDHDLWQMWPTDYTISPDKPFRDPEVRPYGRWVYDTFSSVFELERYYYNWQLRCAQWAEFCVATKRFTVVPRMDKKMRKRRGVNQPGPLGIQTSGGGRYETAMVTEAPLGRGRVSEDLIVRLREGTGWLESRMGGRSSGGVPGRWAQDWHLGIWLRGEDAHYWHTKLFSFCELEIRMDEAIRLLMYCDEMVRGERGGESGWDSLLPIAGSRAGYARGALRSWRSFRTQVDDWRNKRIHLVRGEIGIHMREDKDDEARLLYCHPVS